MDLIANPNAVFILEPAPPLFRPRGVVGDNIKAARVPASHFKVLVPIGTNRRGARHEHGGSPNRLSRQYQGECFLKAGIIAQEGVWSSGEEVARDELMGVGL